jgi:hypothetical protein
MLAQGVPPLFPRTVRLEEKADQKNRPGLTAGVTPPEELFVKLKDGALMRRPATCAVA